MKKHIILASFIISTLVYGNGLNLLNKSNGLVLLKGKNESCRITMTPAGEITKTNCKYITNSKNVNIVCTKRKTMCKTIEEVDSFLYGDTIVKEVKVKPLGNLKSMPYAKARKIILNAGYTIKKNTNPPRFGQAKNLYRKYKEIDDCSSSSTMPCRFEFNAPNSQTLIVITYTEESQNNAIFVLSWYVE